MAKRTRRIAVILIAIILIHGFQSANAQEDQGDIADVKSEDVKAGRDDDKRFFLIEPSKNESIPEDGAGLVIILPGGGGGADFHPFIKQIRKHAIPDGYVVTQPVAIQWTEKQVIVWPTEKTPVEKMRFTTEEFVAAVIKEIGDRYKLNAKKVFTLSWSSSGPAAYAISLNNKFVKGSFIAMSVFKPQFLPPLDQSKDHAYFIYHSPTDKVCPYAMAQRAAKELAKNERRFC